MTRHYHRWYAKSLGRDMELLVFGHGGPPVLVFPTSMGAFFEYEDQGMVHAVANKLEHGALRLFCLSSVDSESWYNRRAHPRHRINRHLQYEDYLLNDVVPLARHLGAYYTVGVTGCSFGAYHAMAVALRHPSTFTSCITMGGAFDLTQFLDGYADEDAYFLNPLHFLPNLSDPGYLDQFRRNKWVLLTGEHDICRHANEAFAAIFSAKSIPHSLHVWGHGSKHDWADWRLMAAAYLP
ncbi:MAG: esterase family protein [Vicinamibacterales bacterium]